MKVSGQAKLVTGAKPALLDINLESATAVANAIVHAGAWTSNVDGGLQQ